LKKIAVLFSGAGSNLAYILDNLHRKEGIEVALTLTNVPTANGIRYAEAHGVPLEIVDSKGFSSREEFDSMVVDIVKQYGVELVVLAGFMRILTPVFTEQVSAINLHPSLLPRHKGMKAIERSYDDEHPEGGVSVHWVTSELDGGEIILQKSVAKEQKSFEEYEAAIKTIEKIALSEAIKKVLNPNVI